MARAPAASVTVDAPTHRAEPADRTPTRPPARRSGRARRRRRVRRGARRLLGDRRRVHHRGAAHLVAAARPAPPHRRPVRVGGAAPHPAAGVQPVRRGGGALEPAVGGVHLPGRSTSACGLVLLAHAARAARRARLLASSPPPIGTVVVALDPVLLSYENTATYELPVATLLVVSGWCCARYARTRSTGAPRRLRRRDHRGRADARAAAPGVARRGRSCSWWSRSGPAPGGARSARRWRSRSSSSAAGCVKNQVLFDEPTMSTILGGNLARGVIAPMPRDRGRRADPRRLDHARGAGARVLPLLGVPARDRAVPHALDAEPVVRALVKDERHQQLQLGVLPPRLPPGAAQRVRAAPRASRRLPRHPLRAVQHPLLPRPRAGPRTTTTRRCGSSPTSGTRCCSALGVTVARLGLDQQPHPGHRPPTIPMSLTLVAATLFVIGLGAAGVRARRCAAAPGRGDLARAYLGVTVAVRRARVDRDRVRRERPVPVPRGPDRDRLGGRAGGHVRGRVGAAVGASRRAERRCAQSASAAKVSQRFGSPLR